MKQPSPLYAIFAPLSNTARSMKTNPLRIPAPAGLSPFVTSLAAIIAGNGDSLREPSLSAAPFSARFRTALLLRWLIYGDHLARFMFQQNLELQVRGQFAVRSVAAPEGAR